MWAIYYGDGSVVRGRTLANWLAAPRDGVQAVVLYERPDDGRYPWGTPAGPMLRDRQVWSGDDFYSLNGWPTKRGSLIGDAAYHTIFARAIYEAA